MTGVHRCAANTLCRLRLPGQVFEWGTVSPTRWAASTAELTGSSMRLRGIYIRRTRYLYKGAKTRAAMGRRSWTVYAYG